MAGPHAAAGALTVALVKPVHDMPACANPAKWREAVAILALHAVIGTDIDLRSAGPWTGHGEGERAAYIAGALFIVWTLRLTPDPRERRIAGDSTLRETARTHGEKARVVIETRLHPVVEPIGPAR